MADPPAPWWSNEKTVLKVTAAIGAFITISGIILLLVFAIQSGLLGPMGRVVLAYGLAVLLAGVAVVVQRKNPDNAGVAAAGSASVITAHITTTVLVHVLEWWPHWLGTIVAVAVTGLGFLAARLWNSVAFLLVGLVAGFVATMVTTGPRPEDVADIGVAVLIVPVAATWAWFGRANRSAVALGAVVVFLFGSVRVLVDTESTWVGAAAFIAAGLAIAVPEFFDESAETTEAAGDERTASIAPNPWSLPPTPGPAGAGGSSAVFPLQLLTWTAAPMLATLGGGVDLATLLIALVLGLAIGAAGFAPWRDPSDARMRALRWAGLCSSAVPALLLATFDPGASWTRIPVLLLAIGFIWFHVFTPTTMGRRLIVLWTVAALLGNLPALVLTMFAPQYLRDGHLWLWTLRVPHVPLSGLLIGACALGLIAIVASRRERAAGFDKWAGLAGLLLTAVPVITLLSAAGVRFSLAHVLVSIGWMVAAAWLMLAPRRLNVDANMAASLVIAGVAVLKLVFYDMQAMSGLTRVAAFLLCGLVMLGMVVARSLRDRDAGGEAAASAPGPTADSGPPSGESWGTGPGGR